MSCGTALHVYPVSPQSSSSGSSGGGGPGGGGGLAGERGCTSPDLPPEIAACSSLGGGARDSLWSWLRLFLPPKRLPKPKGLPAFFSSFSLRCGAFAATARAFAPSERNPEPLPALLKAPKELS